jgi:Family of unknown function (DUF6263)
MKKLVVIFSICAMAICILSCGCSKSKNAADQLGNTTDSSAASSAASDPAEMKIKWNVGKKYTMRMEFSQDTETKLPNQPGPTKSEVSMSQDFSISPIKLLDNGGWQLELEFEDETMDVSQGGRKVLSFDSTQSPAADTNNPVGPVLRAMIGARLQYFTDVNGKVEKVEGVDELMNRFAANGKPQQQAMFKRMFSEDTLKRYGSFGDEFPNRMVNVGESWSVKKDIVSSVGVLNSDIKYTFKNWEQHDDRKCAHIVDTGDISTKSTSNASGAVVEIEKGKISGEFWFDPELGMVVDVNSDQDIKMKVTTRTQTMTPQMTQKIRLTLVDVQ